MPWLKLFDIGLGFLGVVAFNATAVARQKTGADHLQELKNFDGGLIRRRGGVLAQAQTMGLLVFFLHGHFPGAARRCVGLGADAKTSR